MARGHLCTQMDTNGLQSKVQQMGVGGVQVDENRNSNPRLMLCKVFSLAAVITVAGQLHHNKLSPSIKSSNPSLCMPRIEQGLYIMSRIRAEGKADHRRAARLFHMNTPVISCASLPVKIWSRMEHASVQILYKFSRIVLPVRRLTATPTPA